MPEATFPLSCFYPQPPPSKRVSWPALITTETSSSYGPGSTWKSYRWHKMDRRISSNGLNIEDRHAYRNCWWDDSSKVHGLIQFVGVHVEICNVDRRSPKISFTSYCEQFHCCWLYYYYFHSLTEEVKSITVTTCEDKKKATVKDGKATKPKKSPLTGTEVVQIFAQKRHLAKLELYHLKEVEGDSYRYAWLFINFCKSSHAQ